MPQPEGLSDVQEKILLAIWKLKGVGKNGVDEDGLRAELGEETPQNLADAIETLRNQGFLEVTTVDGRSILSMTPLGLAILRKLEEDRLQELK